MHTSRSASPTSKSSPAFRNWFEAARPKTLVAAFVPVYTASCLAAFAGFFRPGIAILCLLCAGSLQIATNFINDASDFLRGADTEERIGPKRMAQSGGIVAKQLYVAGGFMLTLALVFGAYLIWTGGPIFLWLGLGSIVAAVAYTAGPFPLAYLGLGDLFVFLFFGLVAVVGGFLLQTGYVDRRAWLVASAIGLHATSLIAINNVRDIPTDTKAGKRTLAVLLGDRLSRFYYGLLLLAPYGIVVAGAMMELLPRHSIFVLIAAPLGLFLARRALLARSGADFLALLGKTALHHLAFALLLGASLVLGTHVY